MNDFRRNKIYDSVIMPNQKLKVLKEEMIDGLEMASWEVMDCEMYSTNHLDYTDPTVIEDAYLYFQSCHKALTKLSSTMEAYHTFQRKLFIPNNRKEMEDDMFAISDFGIEVQKLMLALNTQKNPRPANGTILDLLTKEKLPDAKEKLLKVLSDCAASVLQIKFTQNALLSVLEDTAFADQLKSHYDMVYNEVPSNYEVLMNSLSIDIGASRTSPMATHSVLLEKLKEEILRKTSVEILEVLQCNHFSAQSLAKAIIDKKLSLVNTDRLLFTMAAYDKVQKGLVTFDKKDSNRGRMQENMFDKFSNHAQFELDIQKALALARERVKEKFPRQADITSNTIWLAVLDFFCGGLFNCGGLITNFYNNVVCKFTHLFKRSTSLRSFQNEYANASNGYARLEERDRKRKNTIYKAVAACIACCLAPLSGYMG